jgi:hypothetical protein
MADDGELCKRNFERSGDFFRDIFTATENTEDTEFEPHGVIHKKCIFSVCIILRDLHVLRGR